MVKTVGSSPIEVEGFFFGILLNVMIFFLFFTEAKSHENKRIAMLLKPKNLSILNTTKSFEYFSTEPVSCHRLPKTMDHVQRIASRTKPSDFEA